MNRRAVARDGRDPVIGRASTIAHRRYAPLSMDATERATPGDEVPDGAIPADGARRDATPGDPAPRARRAPGAGVLLARLTVAPALLLVAWLVVALPLLLARTFQLGPALALFVPVAGLAMWLGMREWGAAAEPDSAGGARTGPFGGPVPWWTVAGVAGVAVAFLVLQLVLVSEQIIVRRDPAPYMLFASWLNDNGSLPVPQMRWAFGGADPALAYASPGFFEAGGSIAPQFMAGLPLILALGGWIGGTHALLAMAPVLGACAVLTFGGLTARLVGPRWGPVGALALALVLPMQWVSRSTYSEPAAMVLTLGGIALLYDARHTRGTVRVPGLRGARGELGAARARALLGGLALGLTVLVRIDGLRDVLPVVVFAGLLVASRHRGGRPESTTPMRATGAWLAAGLLVGVLAGLLEGFVLSRPYLDSLRASLVPLLFVATAALGVTGVMVVVLRRPASVTWTRPISARVAGGRLPGAAALLAVLVMIGFAIRPYVQTVTRTPGTPEDRLNVSFIEFVQRVNGETIDGTRQYSENSLEWVGWYIGIPALLLATFGAALLARRLLRRRSTAWLLPYAIIAWTTLTTLWRPGITPDHPWASRRLIVIVIPGLLLLALWTLAWAVRRIRRLGYGGRVTAASAVAGVLLLIVPAVATSGGLMFVRTEQGEVAALRGLCDRLGPGRSVVVVERVTADRFLQAIRSMCGVPSARTAPSATRADVRRVIGKVYGAGRRPVILGAEARDVQPFGRAVRALHVRTRQDERTLTAPPDGTWSLNVTVWMTEPDRPG